MKSEDANISRQYREDETVTRILVIANANHLVLDSSKDSPGIPIYKKLLAKSMRLQQRYLTH